MIPVALGLGTLALLLWGANAFSRANVANLKALAAWVCALGGLALATMLLLTGRGGAALSGVLLLGPLAWSWWQESKAKASPTGVPTPRMGRAEALEVLGLRDPVSDSDVRAAWVRLMRAAHPDSGGTDWLASRINQARDVLLNKSNTRR